MGQADAIVVMNDEFELELGLRQVRTAELCGYTPGGSGGGGGGARRQEDVMAS